MSVNGGRRVRRNFFGGTGFYIALFLGVTALAVAGYWTLLPRNHVSDVPQTAETQQQAPTPIVKAPAPAEVPVVMPEVETQPVQPVQEIVELPLPEKESPKVIPIAPRLIVSPLVGETVAAFSVDTLTYNETLGDWRTHNGIDIAAPAGTHVLAACSGTVKSVEDDDLMGTTVILTHDGGYETTYANLQSVPAVAAGQYVTAGEILGAVGETSLIESALAPHLHFSVTKNGGIVDPADFLKG